MKTTSKQLAESLYDLVKDKNKREVESIIANFVGFLANNGKLRLAEKIIFEFKEIWNKDNGIIEAEITTAIKVGKGTVQVLKDHVAKSSGAREIILREKVDEDILGGVVIRFGDRVIDGSLKTGLEELKNDLVK